MNRKEQIKALDGTAVDVLIVGAGINGTGTFRDLALNGVSVLLIDKGDFCSGASSASSHMAHGGIRYLENGEFRLVKEAVRERNRMIENAPHIVRPLPTVVPIFKVFSGLLNAPLKFFNLLDKPSERGALVIKLGLILYDSFTKAQKTVPPHTFDNAERSIKRFPHLSKAVKYTATYYDGQILSPERYVIDLIKDSLAEGAHAQALNYIQFDGVTEGKATLTDLESGQHAQVKAKIIVNASGPWIDLTNHSAGLSKHYIGGTKGSHIIVDNPGLRQAIGKHEFFFENKDGRIVLIFPFFDKVIIGTSDLAIQNPDDAKITDAEVDYFLELTRHIFPNIPVTKEQIVFSFCGVRPLESIKAKTAGQITRDHSIKTDVVDGVPVFSLVGGKWTSYRAFSEQTADECMATLGILRTKGTQNLPIGGGRNYPPFGLAQIEFIKSISPLGQAKEFEPRALFDRYGTVAGEVVSYIRAGTAKKLAAYPALTDREINYLVQHEGALHVEDILVRRTSIAWLGLYSKELIREIAQVMGAELGWGDTKLKEEIARTINYLKARHNVDC